MLRAANIMTKLENAGFYQRGSSAVRLVLSPEISYTERGGGEGGRLRRRPRARRRRRRRAGLLEYRFDMQAGEKYLFDVDFDDLYVDTHGAKVKDEVYELLDYAYKCHGVYPTLLERDFNFPALSELNGELNQIRVIQKRHE